MSDNFAPVVPHFSALKELKMTNIGNLTDEGLIQISKNKNIEALSMNDFGEVTKLGLISLKNLIK